MADDEQAVFDSTPHPLGGYLLAFTALAGVLAVIADILLTGGHVLITPVMSAASDNQDALSVIVSVLLLFAYLMQYQNQRTQRTIMDRQIKLMRAGYTPILGGSTREWGDERDDANPNIDQEDANRLYLKISNSGNSTARNLRIWTGVAYKPTDKLNHSYCDYEVPLRRASNPDWWSIDQGDALSHTTDEPTEFQADPKLHKVETGRWKLRPDRISVPLHTALEDLKAAGVNEIEIGFALRYTSPTGTTEQIFLGAYKDKLSHFEEGDMRIRRMMERKEEDVKMIQKRAK